MTVHAAKVLSLNMFCGGLEDGFFPTKKIRKKLRTTGRRATAFLCSYHPRQGKLFLSFANFRTIFGSRQINAPSEFISDIPADLLERREKRIELKLFTYDPVRSGSNLKTNKNMD